MVSIDLPLRIFVCFSLVVQLSLDFDIDSLTTFEGHLGGGLNLFCDFSGILNFFSFFCCLLLEFLDPLKSPCFKRGHAHRKHF